MLRFYGMCDMMERHFGLMPFKDEVTNEEMS